MSTRVLVAALATLFLFVVAHTARADVTGLFTVDIAMIPQTNSQEAIGFYFDLQANLRTNITISGLTFGTDLGFGVTGVEFAIVSVSTNLGALTLADQFVFAQPFGCNEASWVGVLAGASDDSDGGIVGQCRPQFVAPIGSSDGETNDAAVGFVKKRVDIGLDIAGVGFGMLALFEDVDFPDIHGACSLSGVGCAGGSDHEHDHFRAADLYFVGAHDNVVDNQTPSYGFGAVFTITGQTVSGISFTNITGICADNQVKNRIKKRSFPGEVDRDCVTEGGPAFTFTVEKIHVEGIEIGGLGASFWLEFRPFQPASAILDVSFSLAGLAEVTAEFETDNVISLLIDRITIHLVADNFTLLLEDTDADLEIDKTTATFSLTLNPNQNPARFSSVTVAEKGIGLTSQSLELSVTRSGLTVNLLTRLLHDGVRLAWHDTTFNLSTQANVLVFGAQIAFTERGLEEGKLSLSVDF